MKNPRAFRPVLLFCSALLALGAGCSKPEQAATPASSDVAPVATATVPAVTVARPVSTLPVVGPSPAWSTIDLEGKPISAESLQGKVVVVDFWATWCPPCVYEIPGYVYLQKKYADQGLVIVGFSVDQNAAAVPPFAKKYGINYPIAIVGEEMAELFGGLEGTPMTFLIDREGNIRHKKIGAMETDDYEKLLAPLL